MIRSRLLVLALFLVALVAIPLAAGRRSAGLFVLALIAMILGGAIGYRQLLAEEGSTGPDT